MTASLFSLNGVATQRERKKNYFRYASNERHIPFSGKRVLHAALLLLLLLPSFFFLFFLFNFFLFFFISRKKKLFTYLRARVVRNPVCGLTLKKRRNRTAGCSWKKVDVMRRTWPSFTRTLRSQSSETTCVRGSFR